MSEDGRKVMAVKRELMTSRGIRHWSKGLRRKLHRYVYKNKGVVRIPYEIFEDRRILAEYIRAEFGYGHFLLYIWRFKRFKKANKNGKKVWLIPYKIAVIELKEGKSPKYVNLTRLNRFSWFEPKKKSITRRVVDG